VGVSELYLVLPMLVQRDAFVRIAEPVPVAFDEPHRWGKVAVQRFIENPGEAAGEPGIVEQVCLVLHRYGP
jgi:hypothetical protein